MKFKVISPDVESTGSTGSSPQSQIEQMLNDNPVFLFMKGTPESPQCGFSGKVTNILNAWKVPFKSFNVLADLYVSRDMDGPMFEHCANQHLHPNYRGNQYVSKSYCQKRVLTYMAAMYQAKEISKITITNWRFGHVTTNHRASVRHHFANG